MKRNGGLFTSVSVTALSLVLIAMGSFLAKRYSQVEALSFQTVSKGSSLTPHRVQNRVPNRVIASTLDIDMEVKNGSFDTQQGQWQIDDTHAFFAEGTATPILYAHNRNGMFANLSKAGHDDTLRLEYKNGDSVTYVYERVRFVSPDDAGILSESNSDTVVLLTCEGFFNESRRLTYFTRLNS